MPKTHRRLLLAVLAAVAPSAATAQAGTYSVYSCQTPAGVMAPTDGWGSEPYGGMDFSRVTANDCGLAGKAGNLAVRNVTQTNPSPGDPYEYSFTWRAGWRGVMHYSAAPDTSFSKLTVWRSGLVTQNRTATASNHWAGWLGVGSPERPDAIDVCGFEATRVNTRAEGPTCHKGDGSDSHAITAVNRVQFDSLGDAHDVYLVSACIGAAGQYCNPDGAYDQGDGTTRRGGSVAYDIQAVQAEVTDSIAPTASDAAGVLVDTSVLAGTASLSFDATDRGGGLYRAAVEYRPATATNWKTATRDVIDSNGGRCAELEYLSDDDHEFGFREPCPLSATATVALDSTKVKDGVYDIRVLVEDAAGNVTTVLEPKRVSVDNIPAPRATTTPTITGAPRLGTELIAGVGSWSGEENRYERQWLRCTDTDLASCLPIAGAAGETYRVAAADMGRLLRFRVAVTNAEGAGAAESEPVGPAVNQAGRVPQCADALDNDGDGKIDDDDPQCTSRADDDEAKRGAQGATPSSSGNTTTTPSPDAGSPSATDGAATLSLSGAAKRTLRFGRRSAVTLTLRDARGKAVGGGQIAVSQRTFAAGASFASLPAPLVTGADGSARYIVAPGPSRTVRFSSGAATVDLQIRVASKTTLRTSRKFLRNGQTLRFRGRVLSRPVPRSGVGIDLQAMVGRRWQTFRSLTTNRSGRWHASYRFRSTVGLQTYTFRARVRGDSGYPYLPSRSKQVKVRVRG